jgi:hypothetical protein
MFDWQFQLAKNIESDDSRLLKSIHQVFLDGFGLSKGWSIEGIRKRLRTSNVAGFLRKDGEEIYGYAFYSVPSEPLGEAYMLWEDGICLRKEVQGKELTKQVVEKACFIFPGRRFGWVGGRTQNPVVMSRYSKFGLLLPFDTSYNSPDGKPVMDYLLKHIEEVKDVYKGQRLDLRNGICRGIYREGRLGDYPLEVKGTEKFHRQLLQWGFQRDSGDAAIIVSKLTHSIQESL